MKTYEKPSLFIVKDLLLVHTQGTVPLTCSGDFPVSCQSFGASGIDAACSPGLNLEVEFLIPGVSCADPVVDQCTIIVNGQSAASFCDGSLGVNLTDDCGGIGCAIEFGCAFNVNNCSGGEEVVISCPGFESCTQIAVL